MVMEIWTEKYRPDTLDEVVNQSEIVSRLKAFVKNENVPHLLLAGPSGTGKTASAIALVKDLYGENWSNNFKEMNASDTRGINTVRGEIKDFARIQPIDTDYKIIFLDEADALTPEAQNALRRTMENYSHVCRFCLSCNFPSRIIDAIKSRCTVFKFKRLGEEKSKELLKKIAKEEELEITQDGLDAILYISQGDLRKAINLLQSSAALEKEINKETIYEISAQARPEIVKKMVETALKGNFKLSRKKLYELLIDQGVAGEDIVKEIHRQTSRMDIADEKKITLLEKIGEYEFRIGEGSNPQIQLEALLASFAVSE